MCADRCRFPSRQPDDILKRLSCRNPLCAICDCNPRAARRRSLSAPNPALFRATASQLRAHSFRFLSHLLRNTPKSISGLAYLPYAGNGRSLAALRRFACALRSPAARALSSMACVRFLRSRAGLLLRVQCAASSVLPAWHGCFLRQIHPVHRGRPSPAAALAAGRIRFPGHGACFGFAQHLPQALVNLPHHVLSVHLQSRRGNGLNVREPPRIFGLIRTGLSIRPFHHNPVHSHLTFIIGEIGRLIKRKSRALQRKTPEQAMPLRGDWMALLSTLHHQIDTRSSGARYMPSPSSMPNVVKKSSIF